MKKEEISNLISNICKEEGLKKEFLSLLVETLELRNNPFHPLVFINGQPKIGQNVSIGFFSEINAKNSEIVIGDNCDIASFVAINCADSHNRCLEIEKEIARKSIILENNVFVGSHCVIKGGAHIGHHSVIGAGTIVNGVRIPPYSLVTGNPMKVREGYYKNRT
ncbi:MAG: acyltransferase [Sedimentisphaerales bacterium]|nr:acyltransferase [Sedimentisphaerales bacterium]